MWILEYETQLVGERIEIGPCSYDESDQRMGWNTKDEAEQARIKLSAMYDRNFEGPFEVPDDHWLYTGC